MATFVLLESLENVIRLKVRANLEKNCDFKTSFWFMVVSSPVDFILYKCQICMKRENISNI